MGGKRYRGGVLKTQLKSLDCVGEFISAKYFFFSFHRAVFSARLLGSKLSSLRPQSASLHQKASTLDGEEPHTKTPKGIYLSIALSLLQRKVKLLKRPFEPLRVPLLLRIALRAVLPVHPPFQPQQLRHHAPSELQIEAEFRRERQYEFILLSPFLILSVSTAVKSGVCTLVRPPDPDAEIVARLRGAVSDCLRLERGVFLVLGFDFECGVHETLFDEVGGDGQELPVDVDAFCAADFPGYGAEGTFAGGEEEGVQGVAVALHFFVG